jgi:N-methylhydantoinase B
MTAYYRPATLDEALAIRAERPVVILAGGTDVYPARAARAGWGDSRHPDILDIGGLRGLDRIEETADAFRFGCLVTWTALAEAPLPALFDGYRLAAREIGGLQVQNRGTLVGNICTASPAGDGAPNLLALGAEVELASLAGIRRAPMAQFIDGYRSTVCRPDEIVTALIVPKRPGAQSHFLKLGARKYLVISIAMAAGVIAADKAGRITEARIAVGACSVVPQRLAALEAALLGAPLADAPDVAEAAHLAPLSPIDDIRASAEYRGAAALALVRDLLGCLAAMPERSAA